MRTCSLQEAVSGTMRAHARGTFVCSRLARQRGLNHLTVSV